MNLQRHPLSAAFPSLGEQDLRALSADIVANGLREAIVLRDGMVLDGWNRYSACLLGEIEPVTVELPAEVDPVTYVLSRNLHRRHLTDSQRALAVVECRKWAPAGNQPKPAPGAELATAAQMAKEADVSKRTVEDAKAVADKASPEVKDAVRKGKMSVKKGAEIARGRKPAAPKPPKKPAVAPAPAPAPVDPDMPTISEVMEDMEKELVELRAIVESAQADDAKAEAIKQRKLAEHARREQSAAMESASKSQGREKWMANQLRRCGKAVGEDDPEKIAAKVEAFVRERKKVAA